MRKGGGKSKGNVFERKICRTLSLWWSANQFDDLCWRSASSGARGTVSRTGTASYHGDIASVSPFMDEFFQTFSVEVKHYKELDVTELLRDIRFPKLLKFWRQSLKSAVLSKRVPVLIFKTNFYPELIVMTKFFMLKCKALGLLRANKKPPYIALGNKLSIMNFNVLLESIDVEKLKASLNEVRSY